MWPTPIFWSWMAPWNTRRAEESDVVTFIPLDFVDLALAATLIVLNGVLSLVLQLKLERQLLIAVARMVIQLALISLILTTLFDNVSLLWTGLAAAAMVLFAPS